MLNILFSWLSIPRAIGIWIDSIAFSLIDNIYNLIVEFSKLTFFQENTILNVMKSTYVIISIFALFKIALILVNAIISPDKLTDSKNGMGPVLRNLLLMFVLLIFTPTIFNKAYSLQKTIVEGNYVQKIFLQTSVDNQNPGKEMKNIVITALIHPDERIAKYNSETKQYDIVDTGCTGNCKDAVDEYNKMLKNNGDSMFTVFTKYIGVTKKINDETVYVYSYMFIVTLAAGIFITYTLASFGLDIAVRAVELAVLEILSPLFIVTIIEPKSATTGPFHNWLKTVGKTYVSLFIKLAILSFMILFISLINKIDISNIGVMGKVVALLAVLIFAKKAPKWIGDMIGVEGDTAGIGGLGKKLGSAALVGGALTKAGHAAAGAAMGAGKMLSQDARTRRQKRSQVRKDNNLTHGKAGRETRKELSGTNGGYFKGRKALHNMRKQAYKDAGVNLLGKSTDVNGKGKERSAVGRNLGQIGASLVIGSITGARTGLNASDMAGVRKDVGNAIKDKSRDIGLGGKTVSDRADEMLNTAEGRLKNAWGSSTERYNAKEEQAKQEKTRKFRAEGTGYSHGCDQGKIAVGAKEVKAVMNGEIKTSGGGIFEMNTDADKLAKQFAINQGSEKIERITETKNGKEEVTGYKFEKADGEVVQKSVDEIKTTCGGILSPEGVDNFLKSSYAVQQDAVSAHNANMQAQANAISSYNQSQANAAASESLYEKIKSEKMGDIVNALANAGFTKGLESLGDNIRDSIGTLGNSIDVLKNELMTATKDEVKKNLTDQIKILSDLKNAADSTVLFSNSAEASKEQLVQINQSIVENSLIVKSVAGNTDEEKMQTLNRNISDIDKRIDVYKKEEKKE